VINGDQHVLVYDFTSGTAVKGHKGHVNESNSFKDQQAPKAIAYLKQNVILSSVNSNLISYCIASNTIKIFLEFSNRNPITILKQSPKDQNLVAAGTKNGLILLISIDKMEVSAKLRGHDTEISSLDWMYFSMNASKQAAKESDSKVSLENLIASTDTYDCFDIYEDTKDQEFGVNNRSVELKSDDEEANVGDMQEKIVSDSNFNFLEACSSLKSQILNGDDEREDSKCGTYEDNKDQYGMKNLENPSIDESLESNASSRTPVLTDESLNFIEESQRMKDFVIVTKEEIEQLDEIPVLASGSREQIAWLWDINEQTAFTQIKWHPKPRSALPSAFTNILWINQNTLLVTDGNGDINEYNISFDINTRKLIFKHQREKSFDVKGILNMCKSDDSKFLWTSSIHRHISCLDVMKDFEKVISLDTVQLRIHYIAENPIDSNVIAIGGNDKRICLWNTSVANQSSISLRPLMNKIQAGVLCLGWHPEKDNILAFSTREGRICVLDVNKSSNVPQILTSLSSQEVYSIAWAKTAESIILIACNGHKLGYYSQKDQWKLKVIDHLKHSASIAVNGNLAAVGNGNGDLLIVDISQNFKILTKKKVCKKYIGMMTWQGNMLAVSSEAGITLIKNIAEDVSDIPDDQLIKLQGHKGRVFSVRFNKSGSHLVSSCISGYIKVWDLETLTAVSSFNIETPVYSSIFLPSNEDFIVCGGQDSTILTYEWRKHPIESESNELNTKKKLQQTAKKIQWAEPTEVTTISKNSQRRQKKVIVKPAGDDVSELSEEIVKMKINPVRCDV
jgi:WD40 repeat protein